MFEEYGSDRCYELRDWMVVNMEETGLNFNALGDEV